MNQVMPVRLTLKQVGVFLSGKEDEPTELSPMAWLLIQHEGAGGSRKAFADGVGVAMEDVESLIHETTGLEVEESFAAWERGVIALKASHIGGQQRIAMGWDDLEAMALEKLGNQLANMSTNGDPKIMLEIAKAANGSIRRAKGEGKGGGGLGVSITTKMESGGEIEMNSGDIGNITLRFSPRIQAQLSRPDRVIDATAKDVGSGTTQNLQMLRLNETRGLVESMDKADAEAEKLEGPRIDTRPKFDLSEFGDD